MIELTTDEHVYLSTSCFHAGLAADPDEAVRLHAYCSSMTGMSGEKRPARCKFCDARCTCQCHSGERSSAPDAVQS